MFFKPQQPLVPIALCAVSGIIAADWLTPTLYDWSWLIVGAAALLLFTVTGWLRSRTIALLVWIATALLFFTWHAYLLTHGPGATLASHIPAQGCVVEAVGVVNEEPAPETRFQLRLESLKLGNETIQTSAPILVRWVGELPRYGDRVSVIGDLHRLAPPRNPGGFDGPKIWQRQGVYCELRVRYPNDTRILDHDCGSALVARAFALRHWMEATIALDLTDSPELVALIQSMVLGSRGESLAETKKFFQYTGTMHLFAVSGMNVAMLAGLSAWLLRVTGVKRRAMICIVIPLLWVYCYATGLTSSSVRATVMASLVFAGLLIDRPAISWNTLAAATLLILGWNPGQLFTPGFQLSFGMVAFLMLTLPPIAKWLGPLAQPDPFLPRALWSRALVLRCRAQTKCLEALAVSVIAWIGSMPLTVYYFHLWSPASIPANLYALLLAWLMLILGLASVLVGPFWQGLSIVFNNANWAVAKVLLVGISALASLPGGHRFVEMPSITPTPLCEIEIVDVPAGAAIHLRTNKGGRRDWLVDCGSASAFTYSVAPYLRSRGVNNLDGFLLTHGDSQHIGGAAQVLCEMAPQEVIDSPLLDRSKYRRATQAALEASATGKTILSRGDTVTLAPGITLNILFPPDGLRASIADDKAFILRLDIGTKRVLLTSDAGFLTESWLLENATPGELRSDIWIKQTHPKDFSGIPDFVTAVHPALIVASSTSFPPEEHLNEDWATQIVARGIRLLRQDRTGAVKITFDTNGAWKAEPFLDDK